jgi:hypothetical protein
MMGKRIISSLMLVVFCWMIISPALETLEKVEDAHSSSVDHPGDVPCPDGGDEGPCDSECPCFCCPGHTSVTFSPSTGSFEVPLFVSVHRFGPSKAAHPSGIHLRVFRPPRI